MVLAFTYQLCSRCCTTQENKAQGSRWSASVWVRVKDSHTTWALGSSLKSWFTDSLPCLCFHLPSVLPVFMLWSSDLIFCSDDDHIGLGIYPNPLESHFI